MVVWVLPILLLGLPKSFESGVRFSPGNGTESGYQCYPQERPVILKNDLRITCHKEWISVWFTKLQYSLNLINDVSLLIIMLISILLIWLSFEMKMKNQTMRQSTEFGRAWVHTITQVQRKSLYKTAAFLCTPNIVLRLPLYVYGRVPIINPPIGLGICTLLYNLQFCTHFLIYQFINKDYDSAYRDLLRKLFTICMKKKDSDDDINADPHQSKKESVQP